METDDPSVSDVLSRKLEVMGSSHMELMEERLFGELRQRDDEGVFQFAGKMAQSKHLL